ncbi:hypothetical protein Psed_4388 [Pseudonocardia dioxanivorans CB1190]|uniref:Uncharacterized protein n=1 Tax=Pseudonocardia dioxanivorans (strain ATCC 55486 / DSM 44775 / JCM 13855 / CB1190) TaxID=675635 RepID=F4CXH1_PSEUX|nr:hypothetical protein [Pseudonocardia dioxanivorans]AEA26545.1 hypothetical protein Psed_4388 [Pseudonocardia dioxanivorans CB1190]
MSSVGVLILFAIVGAVICAKCRVPAGAVVFALVALVLFVATPAGQGLPGAVSSFLSTVDQSTTPALRHSAPTSSEAVG